MSSWIQSFGVNHDGKDEWYTPPEAIKPILKYLVDGSKILCPFDTAESNFVKMLTAEGYIVEYSHISEGKDFFDLAKPDVDYIISNPPFSKRDAVLKKLYEWDIPFAMIFNTNGIFDSKGRTTFGKDHGVELLYMYPRVKFVGSDGSRNAPPFQSCYWCYKILPEKLMFEMIA